MKAILALVAPAILISACASAPSSHSSADWRPTTTGTDQFPGDNLACSARATRLGNGAVAPDNRLDRPMQRWSNPVAQEVYEACMSERGWWPAG